MRYQFNIAGAIEKPDNEGHEIGSLSDARIHAVRFASEYLRDCAELVWLREEFRWRSPTIRGAPCSPSSR